MRTFARATALSILFAASNAHAAPDTSTGGVA
jgi:hypothetical protein